MKQFTAADVTRNSGDVFAAAAAEPVAITRHRKPRFVVMSIDRYEALTRDSDPRRSYAVDELPDELRAELESALEAGLRDE